MVARFTPDGQLDPTFGNGGWAPAQPQFSFFDLALQPDGKLVAAGTQYEGNDFAKGDAAVVRFNPDGSLDSTFGSGGRAIIARPVNAPDSRGDALAVVIGPDGRILLGGGGEVSPVDGQYDNFELFALKPDGSLDPQFGTGGRVAVRFHVPDARNQNFWRLVMAPDGTLIAAGSVDVSAAVPSQSAALAAFRPDGTPLRSFGTDGQIVDADLYDIRGIQVLPDNSILTLGGSGLLAHFLSQPVVGVKAAGVTTEIQIPQTSAFASSIGSFTFERSGDLSAPLDVPYSVAGTATSAADYVPLPGVVTFAAGQDAVTLPVNPIDDYLTEGTEDVTVSLADVAGYVTLSGTADVAIRDNEGPDRFEPNSFLAQATSLSLVPGQPRIEPKLSLHADTDQDYFSVSGDNRGDIRVSLTFDHNLGQLNLEAYDAAGNLVATAPAVDDRRELHLSFEGPGPAQYFLRVSGAANPDYALQVRYDRRIEVVGRYAFYNRSALDGNNPRATTADFAAIATDKSALLPGQTAGGNNVTNYSRGLNGIIIDVLGLPYLISQPPTPADFAVRSNRANDPAGWRAAARPLTVTLFRGAGVGGSDRIVLIWEDYGSTAPAAQQAVANAWMELTMLATTRTGLPKPDVFSFGNLIGESVGQGADLRVNASDIVAVRRAMGNASTITGRYDVNRDGHVSATDLAYVRANQGKLLSSTPMADPATVVGETMADRALRDSYRATPRQLLSDQTPVL